MAVTDHAHFEEVGDPFDRTVEECAEVIKAIIKYKRFGPFQNNPKVPGSPPNIYKLLDEIADLEVASAQLKVQLLRITGKERS